MKEREDVRAFVIACGIVAGGLYVVLWPVFAPSKTVRPDWGFIHLKVFGTAVNIYLTDFDDRFPPDTSCGHGLDRFVGSYLKDKSLLDTNNGVSREWLGNGSLAFQIASKVEEPARTLVLFDSAPRSIGTGSDKNRHAMFVDTGARSVKEAEFQAAIANDWVWNSPGAKP